MKLTPDQEKWVNEQAQKNGLRIEFAIFTKDPKVNPCIAYFGPGPADKCCKHCSQLLHHGKYLKCDLRKMSRSTATDHRANWPTCARFVAFPSVP